MPPKLVEGEDTVPYLFRMPRSMRDALHDEAVETDTSAADILRGLAAEHIKDRN